ncbi:MAG: pyridoxamine 5'-phosphate oxidase [Neomegalonema sp.]|nr:pyridoxamine 5'-phosphate oxidase [Neomegalonema sp.]
MTVLPADMQEAFRCEDPFVLIETWLEQARQSEPVDANAVLLATVDEDGMPNLRTMLLKQVERMGEGRGALQFFTNYESAKGRELIAHPQAALCFYWKSLGRQIRMRGVVEKLSAELSDAYYRTRPHGSRIGAIASQQSRPLEARSMLTARTQELAAQFPFDPPRPAHWGGFRLIPRQIEFWQAGEFRLHDRFLWLSDEEAEGGWRVSRLNP